MARTGEEDHDGPRKPLNAGLLRLSSAGVTKTLSEWCVHCAEYFYPDIGASTHRVPAFYFNHPNLLTPQQAAKRNLLRSQALHKSEDSKTKLCDSDKVILTSPNDTHQYHQNIQLICPPQESTMRRDKAMTIVLDAFQLLGKELEEEGEEEELEKEEKEAGGSKGLFIISGVNYDNYLNKIPAQVLRQCDGGHLGDSGTARGLLDVVVLQQHVGLVVVQVKSIGGNTADWQASDNQIVSALRNVIGKIKENMGKISHNLRRELLNESQGGDKREGSTSSPVHVLALPFLFRRLYLQTLDEESRHDDDACQLKVLCKEDFEQRPVTEGGIVQSPRRNSRCPRCQPCGNSRCLCSSCDYRHGPPRRSALHVWWTRCFQHGTPPRLSLVKLKEVVGRICGIFSTFTVQPDTKCRAEVRTLGHSVSETAAHFSATRLTLGQFAVLQRDQRYVALSGPPGSGTQLLLSIRAARLLDGRAGAAEGEGEPGDCDPDITDYVVVVSLGRTSASILPSAHALHQSVQQRSASSGHSRLLKCSVPLRGIAPDAVNREAERAVAAIVKNIRDSCHTSVQSMSQSAAGDDSPQQSSASSGHSRHLKCAVPLREIALDAVDSEVERAVAATVKSVRDSNDPLREVALDAVDSEVERDVAATVKSVGDSNDPLREVALEPVSILPSAHQSVQQRSASSGLSRLLKCAVPLREVALDAVDSEVERAAAATVKSVTYSNDPLKSFQDSCNILVKSMSHSTVVGDANCQQHGTTDELHHPLSGSVQTETLNAAKANSENDEENDDDDDNDDDDGEEMSKSATPMKNVQDQNDCRVLSGYGGPAIIKTSRDSRGSMVQPENASYLNHFHSPNDSQVPHLSSDNDSEGSILPHDHESDDRTVPGFDKHDDRMVPGFDKNDDRMVPGFDKKDDRMPGHFDKSDATMVHHSHTHDADITPRYNTSCTDVSTSLLDTTDSPTLQANDNPANRNSDTYPKLHFILNEVDPGDENTQRFLQRLRRHPAADSVWWSTSEPPGTQGAWSQYQREELTDVTRRPPNVQQVLGRLETRERWRECYAACSIQPRLPTQGPPLICLHHARTHRQEDTELAGNHYVTSRRNAHNNNVTPGRDADDNNFTSPIDAHNNNVTPGRDAHNNNVTPGRDAHNNNVAPRRDADDNNVTSEEDTCPTCRLDNDITRGIQAVHPATGLLHSPFRCDQCAEAVVDVISKLTTDSQNPKVTPFLMGSTKVLKDPAKTSYGVPLKPRDVLIVTSFTDDDFLTKEHCKRYTAGEDPEEDKHFAKELMNSALVARIRDQFPLKVLTSASGKRTACSRNCIVLADAADVAGLERKIVIYVQTPHRERQSGLMDDPRCTTTNSEKGAKEICSSLENPVRRQDGSGCKEDKRRGHCDVRECHVYIGQRPHQEHQSRLASDSSCSTATFRNKDAIVEESCCSLEHPVQRQEGYGCIEDRRRGYCTARDGHVYISQLPHQECLSGPASDRNCTKTTLKDKDAIVEESCRSLEHPVQRQEGLGCSDDRTSCYCDQQGCHELRRDMTVSNTSPLAERSHQSHSQVNGSTSHTHVVHSGNASNTSPLAERSLQAHSQVPGSPSDTLFVHSENTCNTSPPAESSHKLHSQVNGSPSLTHVVHSGNTRGSMSASDRHRQAGAECSEEKYAKKENSGEMNTKTVSHCICEHNDGDGSSSTDCKGDSAAQPDEQLPSWLTAKQYTHKKRRLRSFPAQKSGIHKRGLITTTEWSALAEESSRTCHKPAVPLRLDTLLSGLNAVNRRGLYAAAACCLSQLVVVVA